MIEQARSASPLAGKRIGLLTAFASRRNGGVFEAVVQQAAIIRALGGEPHVFALADPDAAADRHRFEHASVSLARVVGPAQIGFAPELTSMMVAAGLDLLHLHGIWMYPSAAGAQWARRTGRPYVVSPHGMLDPWITARGRGKKALARIGYERASWRAAARLHALTPREAGDIERETGRSDAVVIPNAGPPAEPPGIAPREPRLLYLGRIHPKKNIGALIAAWRSLAAADALGDAILTIAGWGADEDVAALKAELAGAPASIRFAGPLFGADKAAAFREARFFVLPSHSEGLPMVVLEAWAAGA
ncbi:MAG: glycosyltransferase, partial [Tsuneonella sp.]